MKPVGQPHLPVPPIPRWEVVPILEETAPRDLRDLPVALPARLEPAAARQGTVVDSYEAFLETTTGLVCLPLGLAILASLPLVNFIALGYLLEAGARVARAGRLGEGLFGIRRAGRVGGLFLGIFLSLLPVWAIASMAQSAELIDPGGDVARRWNSWRMIATVVTVAHIILACLWGGKLRHFLLPMLHPLFGILTFRHCNPIVRARDGVWLCFVEARQWYFFSLGVRGAAGALVWLALPVSCLAIGWKVPALGFFGYLTLLPVLVLLPFLQMNFARLNRFAKMFDVMDVVRLYGRLPWACTFSLFVTLLFALPLYLLKIEVVPRDALFLPAVLFIAFIWPARLLTGWVVGRALRRERNSHWFFLATGALPVPLLVIAYAFVVWLSQYLSWYGVGSLYEQHAFLLPVPFMGL